MATASTWNSDWNAPVLLALTHCGVGWLARQGEDLPPPPKTAIAGPEYFGLNVPEIVAELEALDPERTCDKYWAVRDVMAATRAALRGSQSKRIVLITLRENARQSLNISHSRGRG